MYTIIIHLLLIMYISERVAKIIPDSKTGVLGFVRKVFKFIALYTENIR